LCLTGHVATHRLILCMGVSGVGEWVSDLLAVESDIHAQIYKYATNLLRTLFRLDEAARSTVRRRRVAAYPWHASSPRESHT
jgi:hypothetical protein